MINRVLQCVGYIDHIHSTTHATFSIRAYRRQLAMQRVNALNVRTVARICAGGDHPDQCMLCVCTCINSLDHLFRYDDIVNEL